MKFCLNHGATDPNPKSKHPYPHSYCGKPFYVDSHGKELDDTTCCYHSGYLRITNRKIRHHSSENLYMCLSSYFTRTPNRIQTSAFKNVKTTSM